MANWMDKINQQALDWLIEDDKVNASVRFLALRDIFDRQKDDPELVSARRDAMDNGLIPAILARQHADGYWENNKGIYGPKYFSTIWQVIMLAQMGADPDHPRIQKACEYLLQHGIGKFGGFSILAGQTGAVHCVQGNIAAALLDFGYRDDLRLKKAMDWMARSVTGEDFEPAGGNSTGDHYIRSAISAPGFPCGANDHQPCAWGAVKVALALSKVPAKLRTLSEKKAAEQCIDFLLSVDPVTAEYPHPYTTAPSGSWFKFGFPVFYVTDLLQNFEALVGLGLKGDPRLQNTLDFILRKQDHDGNWRMEYTYNGKTWVEVEEKGKASKWVTLRALRAIKRFYDQDPIYERIPKRSS